MPALSFQPCTAHGVATNTSRLLYTTFLQSGIRRERVTIDLFPTFGYIWDPSDPVTVVHSSFTVGLVVNTFEPRSPELQRAGNQRCCNVDTGHIQEPSI